MKDFAVYSFLKRIDTFVQDPVVRFLTINTDKHSGSREFRSMIRKHLRENKVVFTSPADPDFPRRHLIKIEAGFTKYLIIEKKDA